MDLLPAWRDALNRLSPLDTFLWFTEEDGLLCVIKVPVDVSLDHLVVEYGKPRLEQAPGQEGPVVVLPFSVQAHPETPALLSWSFFNPNNPQDRLVLATLAITAQVTLHVYSTEDLRFQGQKQLGWNTEQRHRAAFHRAVS